MSEKVSSPNRTRAEEQRYINDMYIAGTMSREEWKDKTEELSDLGRWSAKGRVEK